jgi:hypothetical protein
MILHLDQPQGHEIDSSIGAGRISRMGLVIASPIELPSIIPSPNMLVKALKTAGLPQKGDSYPHADYEDYFLKRHIVRAFNAFHYGIEMVYEFRGLMTVQDTSTLSTVTTELHPKSYEPLYVKWKAAGELQPVTKVLRLQTMLPMRHLVVSKTVDFEAAPDVLAAFGGVNKLPWMGLPIGYWLFSAIDAQTVDDGITKTYTATFSTKQKEDWSQLGFMTDDAGQALPIPKADVMALRAKPYAYSIDETVNGLLKVGMHDMFDFFQIFGI